MKKTILLASFLTLTSFAKGQILLEALDAPDPIETSILPEGITIEEGEHFIVSILDDNYLPYRLPTNIPSSWTLRDNPNTTGKDPLIDVKGQIPAEGIKVQIPVKVTGMPTLPAYKTFVSTRNLSWKDRTIKELELSWETQILSSENKFITATIKVKDATTSQDLTQLDLRYGLGSGYRGVQLGRFKLPKNSSENSVDSFTGTYEVRVISGIPDKNFNKEVAGQYRHRFLYVPIKGPDGKLWLNNNLGADYSNINSPHFNPGKQAENLGDYKAYGSLFQFGRDGDGHELVLWPFTPTGRIFVLNDDETIRGAYSGSYLAMNDPCPEGWGTPDENELKILLDYLPTKLVSGREEAVAPLKLPLPQAIINESLARKNYDLSLYWSNKDRLVVNGFVWTESEKAIGAVYQHSINVYTGGDRSVIKLMGQLTHGAIRCVKK